MKKLCALLLAVVMLFSLAACGQTATPKLIEIDLTNELYAFGVDKDQPELLADVNAFIAEIKGNGKFAEICNNYFGDGTPTPVTSAALDTSKDQLVVVTNAEFAPFEYKDGDKYLGIDMEIAALLAEKLEQELVILNVDFNVVCLNVSQKKADIAMAGLTISEDRKEHVTFTESYYTASQRLIVKSDNMTFDECKTVADMEAILNTLDSNVKIGVQNGTTGQSYCEGDEGLDFPGLKVTTKGYANAALAVQDMLNGNIDYVMVDAAPAERIVTSFNKN